ncbi:hypothetical protein [Occallatibacter riparius]|uniref:Uncharacterized protein n=1 Tax=Occallatibacter riparius TaxID=1002689 RepID=A0A9J7BST6_9BACT|nr:hypothetical protein [Occallatibacter riparius]UWZ85649.1 hypothetical protein MOP44_06815 [Occallatibacter riparius]
MASELKAERANSALSVSVGQRVTVGDSETEFVVVNVDHETGRLELLRLKPGRIEADIPVSNVRRIVESGLHLVDNSEEN